MMGRDAETGKLRKITETKQLFLIFELECQQTEMILCFFELLLQCFYEKLRPTGE